MNVLINAYAVSPAWGSEPGMGWNWISNLAAFANIYVITEGEWRKEIEDAISVHKYKDHLHFYYLPVSDKVRKMCWNQGDWRFYYYYKRWQKRALGKAQEIIQEVNIDIIHQLNMVGFREPGYLWKMSKPMVWGPIGGIGSMNQEFIRSDCPLRMRLFFMIKNAVSLFQLRFSPRINSAFVHSSALIAAVPAAKELIKTYKKRDSVWIPETGCNNLDEQINDKRDRKDFHIIWVGKFDFRKRLDIALRSIAGIKELPLLHFHIVGAGNENQERRYKELARDLGIERICEWHGKVANDEAHAMMREADVLFFTSIDEATSTVVPEAINNCLPIVCFNACGFGPLVTDKIGRKVEMTTPEQAISDFASQLKSLYHNKQLLHEMSANCKEALKSLLWEEKAKKVFEIYKEIL